MAASVTGQNGAFSGRTAPDDGADRTSREEDDMPELPSVHDGPTGGPLLLTPEEAAKVLRISRTTIYALMKAGQLRPVHIGRSCRLPRAELERYVRRLEAPPPSAPSRSRGRRRGTTTQSGLFELTSGSVDGA